MANFNERLHGYILELLGIYHWEYATAGRVYVPEDELPKLENATAEDIYEILYDKNDWSFFDELMEEELGSGYTDNFERAFEKFCASGKVVGNPVQVTYGDAVDGFYRLFKNSLIGDRMVNLPTKIDVHIDDPTLGEEVLGLRKRYRGGLRTAQGKAQFYHDAYNKILEEPVFEQLCYDYGCQPKDFFPTIIKVDREDSTVDITFSVDEWMSQDDFEYIRELVIMGAIQTLLDEMEIEDVY